MQASSDIRSAGIPAVTFVNVQAGYPGERGELAVDSNAVSVFEAGEASSRHEGYAGVFDKSNTENDVCEGILGPDAAVNPMAACVGDGATILMLVLGSRKTKKHIFNKRTLLPFVCNELFAAIQDKQSTVIGSYETAVKVGAFEIQDEIITDLLRPSNRGLVVHATPEEGINVAGLTYEVHSTELSLARALEGCCDNRATHTLPPGGSIDTSSCVWELELTQDEEVAGGSVRSSRSKFVICEVPSTDPLVLSPTEMRQLEGPSLHKSLSTFADVTRKLMNPQLAAIAPFRSSKLTHYLSEMLGGNAVVMALSNVIPGESQISRRTLEITSDLAQSVHFPITGHDMTGVLRGLLTKYRSLILQLQDEIANGAPIGDAPPELSEKRLGELQAELAQAHILKNQTKQDYTRLYEMMTMLKEKYKTLADQKAMQSQELITAEEERLNVARVLVELKLEHSNLLESTENDKFELSSSLLAAKSEIYDLDAQLVTSKSEAASAKEATFELEKLLKEEQQELVAKAAALQEVKAQLERESLKNVELGSELLTLVNQKDELNKLVEQLQQKLDVAAIKLTSAQTESTDKDRLTAEQRETNRALEDEIGELKRLQTDHDVEFKRLVGQLDRTKDELDKMTGEFMKERETIYESARGAAEEEIRTAQLETEEIGGMLRKADKKHRDMERVIQRLHFDVEKMQSSLEKANADADDVREKYRKRLAELYAPAPDMESDVEAKYGVEAELASTEAPGKLDSMKDVMLAAKAVATDGATAASAEKATNEDFIVDADAGDEAIKKSDSKDSSATDPDIKVVEDTKPLAAADEDGDAKADPSPDSHSGDEKEADGDADGTAAESANKPGGDDSVDTSAPAGESQVESQDKDGAEAETEAEAEAGAKAESETEANTPGVKTEDGSILEAMVKSYAEKELAVVGSLDNERKETRGIKKAFRTVFDRYQKLLDTLEEHLPTHLPPAKDMLEEVDVLRASGVLGDLDESEQAESKAHDALRAAELNLLDERSKAATLVDGYKKRLTAADAKVVALNEENSMLRAENAAKSTKAQFDELTKVLKKQLENQQDEMLAAQLAMRPNVVKDDGSDKMKEEQSFAEVMEAQAKVRAEAEEKGAMRKKEEEEAALAAKAAADEVESDKIAALEAEVAKLKAEIKEGNGLMGDVVLDANGEVSLAQYNAVRSRLLNVEKGKATLESRVISLEDELKQYNQYMRDSAVMYRRQVASLKNQARQYATAMQELQMHYSTAAAELTATKKELAAAQMAPIPLRLDGELDEGLAEQEAPLESVREEEEEEEEEVVEEEESQDGKGKASSADAQAANANTENAPPIDANASADATVNKTAVPELKLPEISNPEVTGKDSERGPASARLDDPDAIQAEVADLTKGPIAEGALAGGEDPQTILPDIITPRKE